MPILEELIQQRMAYKEISRTPREIRKNSIHSTVSGI